MTEPTTWAAVGLALVGVAQTVGMGWLRLHFKKNRNLGRERDARQEDAIARYMAGVEEVKASQREFGTQLQVVIKEGWTTSSRVSVLETKWEALSRQLDRLERLLERK